MAINCNACGEIRDIDPSFVINGFTDVECASLKNNTGLSPDSGNDNETDLNNLNDCLIGNLVTEVERYDACDWKEYTQRMAPNEWTMFKALICTIAGLQAKVEELETAVNG